VFSRHEQSCALSFEFQTVRFPLSNPGGLRQSADGMNSAIKAYLRGIGSKGGSTTGKSKRRGGSAYYKRISALAAETRRKNAEARKKAAQAGPGSQAGE
jgi:hypothetical protein